MSRSLLVSRLKTTLLLPTLYCYSTHSFGEHLLYHFKFPDSLYRVQETINGAQETTLSHLFQLPSPFCSRTKIYCYSTQFLVEQMPTCNGENIGLIVHILGFLKVSTSTISGWANIFWLCIIFSNWTFEL